MNAREAFLNASGIGYLAMTLSHASAFEAFQLQVL